MDREIKFFVFCAAAILVLLSLVFLPRLTGNIILPAGNSEKLSVGYLPLSASLPLFVAAEKGYFKDQGLEVKLIEFGNSNAIMDALLQGKIDATSSVAFTTLFSIEEKQPHSFRIVAPLGDSDKNYANFLIIKNGSQISKLADLRGKKVLTRTGIANKKLAELFFNSIGINSEDIMLVQVDPSLLIETFASQDGIEALFDVEPYATIAVEKGIGKVFIENPRGRYILNPFPSSASTVSSTLAEKRPEAAQKFKRALEKAVDFIHSNPEVSKELLVLYTPLDKETALKSRLYDFWKGREQEAAVQRLADLMLSQGLLGKRIDTKTIFLD